MADSRIVLKLVAEQFGGLRLGTFDDRLILQKRVYLLKQLGLGLDYGYNWYVRGPYSPALTEDAFAISSLSQDCPDESKAFTLTPRSKNAVERYVSFESQFAHNELPLMLELLASIHYLLHVGFLPGGKSAPNIERALKERGKQFTAEQFRAAWSALDKMGLIEKEVVAEG